MSLAEIKDELVTEIVSEIDVMLTISADGLSLSVYVDEEQFYHDVDWDVMTANIIDDYKDDILYDEEYDIIIKNLEKLTRDLRDAREQ